MPVRQLRDEVQGSCNAAQGPILAWHLLHPPPVHLQITTPIPFDANALLREPIQEYCVILFTTIRCVRL